MTQSQQSYIDYLKGQLQVVTWELGSAREELVALRKRQGIPTGITNRTTRNAVLLQETQALLDRDGN